jgi:peptidoglycan/LPS O-acetylase OafA/YrhL
LINGILNLSFLLMCSTVVVNLVVGEFDKVGKHATGDLIDRRCRRIFPLAYFGLILVMVAVAFLFIPGIRDGV